MHMVKTRDGIIWSSGRNLRGNKQMVDTFGKEEVLKVTIKDNSEMLGVIVDENWGIKIYGIDKSGNKKILLRVKVVPPEEEKKENQ